MQLSLRHSILSPYTSFIAVEEREDVEESEDVEETINIQDLVHSHEIDSLPYIAWEETDVCTFLNVYFEQACRNVVPK